LCDPFELLDQINALHLLEMLSEPVAQLPLPLLAEACRDHDQDALNSLTSIRLAQMYAASIVLPKPTSSAMTTALPGLSRNFSRGA
jgi:hypothetical protein